jgi:hypothetical protein
MDRLIGGGEGNRDGGCDERKGGHAGEPNRHPKENASGQCCEHYPYNDPSP